VEIEVRLLDPDLSADDSRRRVAQQGERLSYKEEAAGSSPAAPMHQKSRRRIAQQAERLSDEEEAAGSTPAPPIPWRKAGNPHARIPRRAKTPEVGRFAAEAAPRPLPAWP
jgi:hypothetical protein